MNYRNTEEVFRLAGDFATHYLQPMQGDKNQTPLQEAKSAGRHGVQPELRRFNNFAVEVKKITSWLQHWHEQHQIAWFDICVLYRSKEQGGCYIKLLKRHRFLVNG